MIKHLLVLCVLVGLLCSSLGPSLTAMNRPETKQTETLKFSTVTLQQTDSALTVFLPEATSMTTTPDEPMLPIVTKIFTLPFRSTVESVTVHFDDESSQPILMPLHTATSPLADDASNAVQQSTTTQEDQSKASFSYHLAAGRSPDGIVNYLAVHLCPTYYDAQYSILYSYGSATITITYQAPKPIPQLTTTYSLVIIAPDSFAAALQPLIAHKIAHGMTTKLVTISEINNNTYFPRQGRDHAEELKYFIKDAADTWNTSYVLLVGGRKGGVTQEKWLVPVRYSRLDDGGEGSYLTDLYFSDIYEPDGNFSSWDSNGNGLFAEWTSTAKDVIDMYPDVFVGRLPCSTVSDVKTMVKKIIAYESTTAGKDWFKHFIGVAGDTYPDANDTVFEGEAATAKSFSLLEPLGFTATFLWTSLGTFQDKQDVIDGFSEGAGFVHFSGHGNPSIWSTHKPYNNSFVDGLSTFDMRKLHNGEKLPVVIVGGCHNAQYNTSLWNIPGGVLKYGWKGYFSSQRPFGKFYYMEWVPRCWGWNMLMQPHGGCIGLIANTGLGYGQPGWDTLNQSGRCLEWKFFASYAAGNTVLGATHGLSLVEYMNLHPPMADQMDCKIIQEWGLLGDPSLQIGGYS